LVGKPEEKGPVGRPCCIKEPNIRTDHRDIAWEVVDWKHLVQERDQRQNLKGKGVSVLN
jgi:hypothetical protein